MVSAWTCDTTQTMVQLFSLFVLFALHSFKSNQRQTTQILQTKQWTLFSYLMGRKYHVDCHFSPKTDAICAELDGYNKGGVTIKLNARKGMELRFEVIGITGFDAVSLCKIDYPKHRIW